MISVDDTSAHPGSRRRTIRRLGIVTLNIIVFGYLLSLLAACFLIRDQGERWWFATLMLFGPRWMLGLPLIVLMPLTGLVRRRLLPVVLCCGGILAFAILHFAIPWKTWNLPATRAAPVRLFTCNSHRQYVNAVALLRAIKDAHPDLVLVQEWTTNQSRMVFSDPGWHILVEGQMLLASRHPIRRVYNVLPAHPYLEGAVYGYDIELPGGTIRLINVHLASPHLVFKDALLMRPGAADEIANNCRMRKLESEITAKYASSTTLPTLIAGDFNTPLDSETFRTNLSNFTDAFSVAGTGLGITYRTPGTQTRIDHILFDRNWQCTDCRLGPEVGSPHLPVIADLERVPE